MSIRKLHIMLLNICEFREFWHKESRTFLNKLNYVCSCALKPCDILEIKKTPCESLHTEFRSSAFEILWNLTNQVYFLNFNMNIPFVAILFVILA